jgi:hypothetical protein
MHYYQPHPGGGPRFSWPGFDPPPRDDPWGRPWLEESWTDDPIAWPFSAGPDGVDQRGRGDDVTIIRPWSASLERFAILGWLRTLCALLAGTGWCVWVLLVLTDPAPDGATKAA